jgi:hypothetical protein
MAGAEAKLGYFPSKTNPAVPDWISGTKKSTVSSKLTDITPIATDWAGREEIEALNRQTAAINAQLAAQPKLIYYDTEAAWKNAQNTAAKSVNPVYTDYLNNFLEKQKNLKLQTTAETTAQKTASDTTLSQTQEDIGTNRTRTAEDTATAIAQNLSNENYWATGEGTENAAAEDAARLALGDQGVMGRGAGTLEQTKLTRNLTSKQQTEAFQQERDTKKLLETRTFADLDTKGVRAVKLNTTEKSNLDRQLANYITNQKTELKSFKSENESKRLDALYGATQNVYTSNIGKWLASLIKTGARSQDIALAKNIYG